MRTCVHALATIALLATAEVAQAQPYPVKPITIVVPAAPGGVSDVLARALAQRLTEAWGQQVIVENKGGANHIIGAASVEPERLSIRSSFGDDASRSLTCPSP